MSGREDADAKRRNYNKPYTPHHTIPTIAKFREEKEARKRDAYGGDYDEQEPSRREQAREYWNSYWQGDKDNEEPHADEGAGQDAQAATGRREPETEEEAPADDENASEEQKALDTSEADPMSADPKARRKNMKKRQDERVEREVTDPVTHLPVTIHDYTGNDLKETPENDAPFGTTPRSATGLRNKSKSDKQLAQETGEQQRARQSTDALFPPPNFEVFRRDLMDMHKNGVIVGLVGAVLIIATLFALERLVARWKTGPALWATLVLAGAASIWYLIMGIQQWIKNRVDSAWEDEIWEASRKNDEKDADAHETESVTWLNSLLGSIWPLVNPDLFASLSDTLEDVMQASLPSLVQMVSVDDVGQGSESIRILGVRWLPTGAASRSVDGEGTLKSAEESRKDGSNRKLPGQSDMEDTESNEEGSEQNNQDQGDDDGSQKQIAEGMEAEEGDFINLEIALAYRTRSKNSDFKDRSKDMHLYLAFYLPGGLKLPVWVDVRGFIGTMRLRLQLAPDPPFFALCTVTFLGQPKVDISCIPLFRQALNIMDLPLISNFVQSSVDAAMAEYVAPKSLTLDLKDMLAGDDFKKDTTARGVIVVFITRGYDFKTGDAAIPLIKEGGSDPYVSCAWAKFGKPMFSTRVLMSEMEPTWRERTFMLVTPDELNVDERLRVQLWDSDRFTTDDDLGRIELDLKHLMTGDETNGKMQDRTDGFRALKAGEEMPGKLEWSVGYFSKVRIQPCQLEAQTFDPEIRSFKQLEERVDEDCRRKLREANIKEGRDPRDVSELEQQKAQEMKTRQDAMIISAPPPEGYPSGIFSITVHQITGLSLEQVNKAHGEKNSDDYEEAEQGEGLPSAYCTVIINHNKVFKTRTKPANSKPFYNAGIERFIADWTNAEVHVSVRDARVKEEDPLIGIVHLPLHEVFKERSQINGYYPLMGGVGFGRVRISMVWRSVQLQASPKDLGWSYGTLEVKSGITAINVPEDLQHSKLRFHTDLGYGKQYAGKHDEVGHWHSRKNRSLKLPVKRRYGSCLAIEFRNTGSFRDSTSAFCTFWLRQLVDEEEQEVTLPIYKGNYKRACATSAEQPGEQYGELKLKLTFWSGLGGAHDKWTSKDKNLRDVIEVLECTKDNEERHQEAKEAGIEDDSASDDDESEDSSQEEQSDNEDDQDAEGEDGGKGKKKSRQNIIDSFGDYKKNMRSEHRRHRGVMQWKIPRSAKFAAGKMEKGGHMFSGIFKHHTREPGIETEV
ncbi:hypothetical protein KC340_g11874 [Hortaea werneckii]|nr:hypothetical protein KC342_g12192 [Hortaea werneckii]KAI7079868.1 hypothetical protein KC339_g13545 [Hortaea werneckii]KAI7216277.1 hypothetical protein KC365_g13331 [Hortaea werneckii]KAI7305887.1 hypothetical protein KC340_g11874 [Hortaea werneckii]KAI7388033.1 hypothetical protein KC328_g9143 [Hortaea werneckii]